MRSVSMPADAAGIIGTLGNGLVGALRASRHTPDAALVHATLAEIATRVPCGGSRSRRTRSIRGA
jgi:hypothetical protein